MQTGDLLVSSGLGGAFPAGYPVAEVVTVERRPGEPFMAVEAEPTGALIREREVLLVWGNPPAAEEPPADALEEAPAEATADADTPAADGEPATGSSAAADGDEPATASTAAPDGDEPADATTVAQAEEPAEDEPEARP